MAPVAWFVLACSVFLSADCVSVGVELKPVAAADVPAFIHEAVEVEYPGATAEHVSREILYWPKYRQIDAKKGGYVGVVMQDGKAIADFDVGLDGKVTFAEREEH